ncbi:potassium/proton antiporter [Tenggerimyces flavus]|uniref:Potassium/proton antiporter n=1 Tax=Tenggerimyces flavus TaxID=1708749 RepID=A0ABV7YA36_9ACTN|nr:potassium/proton antiporter [Tenggerimyces flavus]MBM7783594.1 cell volume regulation protein A [Tenggerimyces flavus]
MSPLTVDNLNTFLLASSAILLAAALAVRLSSRAGFPSLLIYLAMGIALGESGLGIQFDDVQLAHALGFGALVIILAEGGFTTRWSDVKGAMPAGVVLATVGVAVSITVVAVIVHYTLGFDWQLSFLLGAVVSPTDAAAIFSVLRRVPLPRRIAGTLEAESGLNDAPTVLLVTLLSSAEFGETTPLRFVADVAFELVVGAVFGFAIGWLGSHLLKRLALPASGLYPLATLSLIVLAYAASAAIHASGFAAVYVSALVLGNSELMHRAATRSFVEGFAWLSQIGLFVMLGLLAWPSRVDLSTLIGGLVAGVALTFIARPLSVGLSLLPFRVPLREHAFVSWAGLRGAVPIVLATIPLSQAFPRAEDLFDVVFVLVIVFTLMQGPTLPWVAKRLGVGATDQVVDLDVEAAPLERIDADLLEITIGETSRLRGVEIGELRLPVGASVSLIVREGKTFVPSLTSVLRIGDDLLVVAPRKTRDTTERRLRAVSRFGRLAGWSRENGDA